MTKHMGPYSEIDLVITDANDNKIKLTYDTLLNYQGCDYVVGTTDDDNTNLFKVVEGLNGKPELHDILDEEEFESVKAFYLSRINQNS